MTPLVWAGVVLIGGAGAVARFVVDDAIGTALRRTFPLGTLVINLTGSLLLGLLVGLTLSDEQALLAGTAAVGSYTTFSTWMFETHRLDEERQYLPAVANVAISLVLGVAAAALGRAIA